MSPNTSTVPARDRSTDQEESPDGLNTSAFPSLLSQHGTFEQGDPPEEIKRDRQNRTASADAQPEANRSFEESQLLAGDYSGL